MRTYWDFSANTRLEKHKPKRSGVEKGAESIVAQDRAGQSTAYGNVNATDANFAGKTQDTPYYKSLLATSTDATSNAYENAKASSAARAKAAGFGYGSPIGDAASRETTGAEAGALAELPAKATAATAPLQLEAAGQQLSEGTALGQQATQTETGAVVPLEEEYMKRNTAFQNRLWDMGLSGIQKGAQLATGV
jgi:hypothetical protein